MLANKIGGPAGIRTRVRGSGNPDNIQAIPRVRTNNRIRKEFWKGKGLAVDEPAILWPRLRGWSRNEDLCLPYFLNSVYPHFPHATRSPWVAMNTPGPHLGQTGFSLSTLSPLTLYAVYFAGAFLGSDDFFAAILTPPPWARVCTRASRFRSS